MPGSLDYAVFETHYDRVGLGANALAIITGTTFTVLDRTLYTRLGDWFGWLMVFAAVLLVGMAFLPRNRRKSW